MDTSKSYYGIVRLKFASSVYSYLRWCWCLRWGRYLGEWVGRVCLISRFVPTQTSFSAALLPGGQQDGTESHLVLLTYLRETILKGRGWAGFSFYLSLVLSVTIRVDHFSRRSVVGPRCWTRGAGTRGAGTRGAGRDARYT